ncbi:hypothetical protein RHMOL_Rhmol03G0004000 [Rhododendron molle]|uniref:Uncharacterized protein n=1 Tax=Rhododendron molle TaxID=49168 RepID=A0ACC0PA59_RHOML|nr:hypothetical protein RHMOL_Rhmol03G0004000 [Rhododendron molle]
MEKEASSLQLTTTSLASQTKWEYKCIFCDRTFDSGRALGGHQNAHRFEPRESKRTHHVRIPKEDRPPVVPHKNLWPPPNPSLWPPNPKNDSYYHGYPMTMQGGLPPCVADRREHEWEILVAGAGQGMQAEGSRNGPYLNATNADHGVQEVDLELKL